MIHHHRMGAPHPGCMAVCRSWRKLRVNTLRRVCRPPLHRGHDAAPGSMSHLIGNRGLRCCRSSTPVYLLPSCGLRISHACGVYVFQPISIGQNLWDTCGSSVFCDNRKPPPGIESVLPGGGVWLSVLLIRTCSWRRCWQSGCWRAPSAPCCSLRSRSTSR